MTPKPKCNNPIVEFYREHAVRQYPRIHIRVSVPQYKQFIDAKIDFGLSHEQAIKQGKALCYLCTSAEIKRYR
jgi:hypothetical protein